MSTPLQNFLAKNLTDIDAALDEITEPARAIDTTSPFPKLVLSIPCRRCGVGRWQLCVTPSRDTRPAHIERRNAANGET